MLKLFIWSEITTIRDCSFVIALAENEEEAVTFACTLFVISNDGKILHKGNLENATALRKELEEKNPDIHEGKVALFIAKEHQIQKIGSNATPDSD